MLSNQTLSSFFVFYGTATLFLEITYSLVTSAKREAILFLFGCSEVNNTWLITSELANQRARKILFTCVVYTKKIYSVISTWSFSGTNLILPVPNRTGEVPQADVCHVGLSHCLTQQTFSTSVA